MSCTHDLSIFEGDGLLCMECGAQFVPASKFNDALGKLHQLQEAVKHKDVLYAGRQLEKDEAIKDLSAKLDEHQKHAQVQLKRAEDAEEELATHLNVHLGVVADNQDLRKRLRDAESRLDTATRLLSVAIKEWAGWMDDARGMEPVDPEYAEAKAFLLRNKADVERRDQNFTVDTYGDAYDRKPSE